MIFEPTNITEADQVIIEQYFKLFVSYLEKHFDYVKNFDVDVVDFEMRCDVDVGVNNLHGWVRLYYTGDPNKLEFIVCAHPNIKHKFIVHIDNSIDLAPTKLLVSQIVDLFQLVSQIVDLFQ